MESDYEPGKGNETAPEIVVSNTDEVYYQISKSQQQNLKKTCIDPRKAAPSRGSTEPIDQENETQSATTATFLKPILKTHCDAHHQRHMTTSTFTSLTSGGTQIQDENHPPNST